MKKKTKRSSSSKPAAVAAVPPVNLGACSVNGCDQPAVAELHWPAAAAERYCADHGERALRGEVGPSSRANRPKPRGGRR